MLAQRSLETMQNPPYFSGFAPLSSDIEARLMPEAKPQYFKLDGCGDAVVICLHGFTGMPYEVEPALRAIANIGLPAVAPLLPGHGYRGRSEQEHQFARITLSGMLEAARQEIARAREQYRWVGMFGFSMGGAIALTMAAEGLLDVCAVAAPALRLPRKASILIPLLSWPSFTVEAPSQEPFYVPTYDFHHSWALRTLWQISRYARQRLPRIHCPVMGVHSRNDTTVPPVVLGLMQNRIPVPVETAWFDDCGHCMLLDVSGPVVAETVAQFFRGQLLGRSSA